MPKEALGRRINFARVEFCTRNSVRKDVLYVMGNTEIARDDKKSNDFDFLSFGKVVDDRQKSVDSIMDKVIDVLVDAGVSKEFVEGTKQTSRYVVNMTEETKAAIADGRIKLDQDKDGRLFAQLRDANNRYGNKFSISEELEYRGINTLDVVNAFQMRAIKQQLEQLAVVVDSISSDVKDVLQGQQNDRLGLFYSGKSLFLESQSVQDPMFKAMLSCQALKSLSDSSAQMIQQLQSDVNYLTSGNYQKSRGKRTEEISNRMLSINKCFEAIHKTALLKATVYYEHNELSAMLESIKEYGRFLEAVVLPNAPRLAEFDRVDNLLRGDIWEKRCELLGSVNEIQKQLSSGSVFYLADTSLKRGDDIEG